MFDDHTQQPGGTVPPNLPTAEPEDIFAGVEQEAPDLKDSAEMPINRATNPVISEVPATKTALSAGVLRPKHEEETGSSSTAPQPTHTDAIENMPVEPSAVPSSSTPSVAPLSSNATAPSIASKNDTPPMHTMPTDAPEMYTVREPRTSKGILTAIIVVIVVLILGGGAVFIYTQFISQKDSVPISAGEDSNIENTNDTGIIDFDENTIDTIDTEEDIEDIDTTVSAEDRTILFGEPVDTDADGLDDERERNLGTDEAHWDTDGDELSDGDEVIIWKTDPLNPDSDGDGYKDGAEIRSGYSPTGPGKIFEPPAETPTTTS